MGATEKGIMLSGIKHDQAEADLSDQGLKATDAILIASDLRVSAMLTTLILYDNRIGDEGAKALASSLEVNAVLTKLDLGYNRIGDEGKQAVRDAAGGREGFELDL